MLTGSFIPRKPHHTSNPGMTPHDHRSGSSTAPVEPGETYHLQIEDLGREGDGIGYLKGFVIIVPGTGLGDWVTVTIETVHDTFAIASTAEEATIGDHDPNP